MNRRSFVKGSFAGASSLAWAAQAPRDKSDPNRIVDTHVYVSHWPGRRVPGDQTPDMVGSLRALGVVEAWAGSFDALLHRDIAGVNARLVEECNRYGKDFLVPFGAVNPTLPDWEEDLRRCHEEFRMRGIRLHPNYQGYELTDPVFARLLRMAAERGLLVQIVAWMEDERTQHHLLQARIVDLSPLVLLLEKIPAAKVSVLNGFISVRSAGDVLPRLRKLNNITFDFAMLEQLMGLRVLIQAVGLEKVVFGSYSPMFYFESAFFKIRESALSAAESKALVSENARRLMA